MQRARRKKSLVITALTLTFVLIAIPVITSLLFFHGTVSRQMESRAEETAAFYAAQLGEKSETAMAQLRNIAYFILGSSEVRAVMQSDGAVTGVQKNVLQNALGSATLYNTAWEERYLYSIFLFRHDGAAFPSTRSGFYQAEINRMRAIADRFSDYSAINTLVTTGEDDGRAYLILDYNDLNSLRPLGKLVFEINLSALVDASSLETLYPGTDVVLSNAYGAPLAAQSSRELQTLAVELMRLGEDAGQGPGFVTWAGEESYHRRQQLDRSELNFDIFIPGAEIFASVRESVRWYVCLTLLMLFMTFVAGLGAYRLLVRPLLQTRDTLDRMAAADLTARMPEARYRELDGLTTAFNRMADRLEALYQEAYDKGVLLRESEMKMLEAQINPHFIFNVLQVVNLRCLEAGERETARLVTDLASLLRGTIGRNGQPKVTFRQELDYVRYYLDLQKARFQDDLHYQIDYADPEILTYALPKLIIQPLVENSVVHGLEPKRGGGTVQVKIWEEDDSVYIRVEDDGVGFAAGFGGAPADGHNHVALDNIRRRVQLMYGNAGEFHIRSTPGQGTVALLVIPIDKSEA